MRVAGGRRRRLGAKLTVVALTLTIVGPSLATFVAQRTAAATTKAPPLNEPAARVGGPAVTRATAIPITLPSGGGIGASGSSGIADAGGALGGTGERGSIHQAAPVAAGTELSGRRTEHSRTVVNENGSFSLQFSGHRLNYLDSSGAWQPIDLSLVQTPDAVFGLKTTANDRVLELGTSAAKDGLAILSSDKGTLTLAAVSASDAKASPLSDGVDYALTPTEPSIHVRATDTGFEFGASWSDITQLPTVSFLLDTHGLNAVLDTDGRTILLQQPSSLDSPVPTTIGYISAPALLEGGPYGIPAADEITSVSIKSDLGTTVTLTYAIDPAWFVDPSRVFPLVLDPNACIGSGVSGCTINDTTGSGDTFVLSSLQDSYPTGWSMFRVGRDDRGTGYGSMRSLLYFPGVTLPDGAVITTAALRTYICSGCVLGSAQGQTIYAYRIVDKDGWDSTETWHKFGTGTGTGGNGDGYTTSGAATDTVPASGHLYFDVSTIVRKWYTRRGADWSPNIGFALKMACESSSCDEVDFERTGGTNPPYLEIIYETDGAQMDFDSALGTSYSPSTMLAGQTTTLPLLVKNTGSTALTTAGYKLGYRFFDGKGNVVASAASQALPSQINVGSTVAVNLSVTPPATVGQYTLRLDVVNVATGTSIWFSDWAQPSKFYSRDKRVLKSDSTRWTGSSKIEREEFSINVVSGAGIGKEQTVGLGDGGSFAINLWSKDLSYSGAGGVGFEDVISTDLSYGYHSRSTSDCTGVLAACGWWTVFDEQIVGGPNQTGYDYTYQDDAGNRMLADTDSDGQITSSSGSLIERPRLTLYDDSLPNSTGTTLVTQTAETPTLNPYGGSYFLKFGSGADQNLNSFTPIDLNVYRYVSFAAHTNVAAGIGIDFKIKVIRADPNADPVSDFWLDYVLGSDFTPGAGTKVRLLNDATGTYTGLTGSSWYIVDAQNLYQDARDIVAGSTYDDFQVIAMQTSSNGTAGNAYLDAVRLEPGYSTFLEDSTPTWSSGGTLTGPYTADKVSGTSSIAIKAASVTVSPDCNTTLPSGTPCWSTSAGGLWAYPFVSWSWKKVGGGAPVMIFHVEDESPGAPSTIKDIAYYAGPTKPSGLGTTPAIQVSDTVPLQWTRVDRNLLEDARQALGMFTDAPTGSSSTAPPAQGPTPDVVRLRGYRISAVDGSFVLVDKLLYGGLAEPVTAAGTVINADDFRVTDSSGEVHWFNRDGRLTKIVDKSGNQLSLDYTRDVAKVGVASYALSMVRAATDGTTAGAGDTFRRRIQVSSTGTGPRTVTFAELLGTVAHPASGRATAFTIDTNNDVTGIKPARTPACAGTSPTGCVTITYATSGTLHLIAQVLDPRWTGSNTFGYGIATGGLDPNKYPTGILDLSNGSAPLLTVRSFDVGGATPASTRVVWQDGPAAVANAIRQTDITSDGGVLVEHVPQICTSNDCSVPGNWPAASASTHASEHQFDGLARASSEIAYRCPGIAIGACAAGQIEKTVTRQGTRAAVKIDNYNDPLTASETAWSQTSDQYFASMRDSGGTDPDLYRTVFGYNESGQQVLAAAPAYDPTADYAAAVKATSPQSATLKAYWRFGESSGNPVDSSGNGVTATATSITYNHAGAPVGVGADKAFSFNGSSSKVTSSLALPQTAYTIEAWVKSTSATQVTRGIAGRWTNTGAGIGGAFLYIDLAGNYTLVHTATSTNYLVSTVKPRVGAWDHVVGTWDGAIQRLYVNGVLIGSQSVATAPGTGAAQFEIGLYNSDASKTFSGDIDEVALYSQALTPSEVEDHWLAGRSIALISANTQYDTAWRPLQRDDQALASPGFESGLSDWERSGGSLVVVDPLAGNDPNTTNVHAGFASFSTGLSGWISQDVRLVPGQTFRFQTWAKVVNTVSGQVTLQYYDTGSGAWTNLPNVPATLSATGWTSYAWDVTLPLATDGRVRVKLAATGGSGSSTVYFDDAALLTSWATIGYGTYGLPTSTQTLANPASGASISAITTSIAYAINDGVATAMNAHPAIWPTTTVVNDVVTATAPDQDVTSTVTYDAWGHSLVATDPDGVKNTSAYVSSGNGAFTDVASTTNGLDLATALTFDEVGNKKTVTTPPPLSHVTTTAYNLASQPTLVTDAASLKARTVYNAAGLPTATYTNDVDEHPSSTGLDDLKTSTTYDAFGNPTSVIADDSDAGGQATGYITAKTSSTYDAAGHAVTSTIYGDTGWSDTRTSQSFFEVTGTNVTRNTPNGVIGPIAPAGAAGGTPCPPPNAATMCSSAGTLDLGGRQVESIDAYGVHWRTYYDLAGRVVFTIANYVDGVPGTSTADDDVIVQTAYDLAGKPTKAVDATGRSTVTVYDALDRATAVTSKDTAGADVSVAKTVYTTGGRTDRVSAPDKVAGITDAQRSWTKTVYDLAGRATKTLAHYDIGNAAGLLVDSFEGDSIADRTFSGDGVAERWDWTAGVFIAAGPQPTENHAAADAIRGTSTLDVAPGATNKGVEWKLDGTFKSGRTYKANVWVKGTNGTTVTVRFGTATDPVTPATGTLSGNGTWKKLTTDLTWTPTADRTGAVLAIYDSAGTATFRVDDAVVWDVGSPDLNDPTSETVFDTDGQIVRTVAPPGVLGGTSAEEPLVTTTLRDALERPTTVTVNYIAGGSTTDTVSNLATSAVYDALGRTSTTTDPSGTVTRYEYDRLGRVITTTQNYIDGVAGGATTPDDVKSTFAYDAAGELGGFCPAAQVFATGCDPALASNVQAWHYAFDKAGHLAVQTPPDNATNTDLAATRWEYNTAGRLDRSCDTTAPATSCPSGGASVIRTVIPTYDDLGRSTATDTFVGATATNALRSEAVYYRDGQPQRSTSMEGSGNTVKDQIDFAYDLARRPTTLTRVATSTVIAAQSWNEDGTVKDRTDADAGALGTSSFAYDWAKRLTTVTEPSGFGQTASFTWRPDGLLDTRKWSTGGSAATFVYDAAKRVVSMTKGTSSLAQAYDRDGNVTSETHTLSGVSGDAGSGTQSFGYDALNRVTSSTGLASSLARGYTYDRDGNRATKVTGTFPSTTTFTYSVDRTDELISVTKTGQSAKNFAYDARGNLTTDVEDGVNTIASTYDLGNKLTGIDPTGTANDATFTFDALGRNWTRSVGTTPSVDTYSYVGATETVARIHNLTSGVTVDTDSLVDPAGDRLGVKVGTTINWLLPDLHGSVAGSLLADQSGFTNALRYDPYGETLASWSGSGGSTPVGEKNWKYQGRLDVSPTALATPLYDGGARYYAPGMGAFTSLDTVAGSAQNPLSMNRFLYAEANPATMVDPTGHCARWIDDFCADARNGSNAVQKHAMKTVRARNIARREERGDDLEDAVTRHKQTKFEIMVSAAFKKQQEADAAAADARESTAITSSSRLTQIKSANDAAIAAANRDCGPAGIFCLDAHTVLDIGGMIPGVGVAFDVANAGLYASEGDWANAGLSLTSAVPVVGDAVGAGKFALKHADEVADIVTHADEAAEVAGGGIHWLDNAADAGASCLHSFSPDTAVTTPSGSVPIADIDVGETVTARDPGSGQVADHTVTHVDVHTDQEIEHVRIDGETIETTPDHRFLTDTGWVEAAALYPGTQVVGLDGSTGTVEGYAIEVRPVIMWDLTVSDVHTFAVGEGQWVVHNAGPCLDTPDLVPDTHIVVRSGTSDLPVGGTPFSGAAAGTLDEAAGSLPYGTIRTTTAGEIRAGGGSVQYAPELTRGGNWNPLHVNICLGSGSCPFGQPFSNPVPRALRLE